MIEEASDVLNSAPGPETLIVVSGMSGSGKSIVLRTLEDLGFYCVDNLPADLLPEFVGSVRPGGPDDRGAHRGLAVGIDVRNQPEDLGHLPMSLSEIGQLGFRHFLVFLDASDDILLKRYSDTRRRHPLGHGAVSLAKAIEHERRLLAPLVSIADLVVDSSAMNVHELRREVVTRLALEKDRGLSLLFESFAYRRGLPPDADFVFDARHLPNPHWDPGLRPLCGRDAAVREWFAERAEVDEYADQIVDFLRRWLPSFASGTRSYLTVAIGCTGGRHRSVHLVETIAARFRGEGLDRTLSFHRELD